MPSIAKPRVAHPSLARNELGLTVRDYEGTMSTLCAGCGHDSITAAIVRALWELSTPPHRIAKLSGIGCSSKTPTYFVKRRARFELGPRPHAAHRDRRQRGQSRTDCTSASRAMAIRFRSASATFAMPCAATSTCFTSSRTTASTV